MHFTKYNGLGNDFIFLDGPDALAVENPASLARCLCRRRTGIGADGLILLLPSKEADVRMRIINSDGSEAEMCGNASRCVALHLQANGGNAKKQFVIETLAGLIQTEVLDFTQGLVRVNMGTPRWTRGSLPMEGVADDPAVGVTVSVGTREITGTGVSMGNPHFVVFVPQVAQVPVEVLGPQLENSPAFPHRTNVEFVQILSDTSVRMRVWERGAGITQACGTGACATAAACVLNGLTQKQLTVHLDGGDLRVEWPEQKAIFMTGPAQRVFEGEVTL